jgi:hypothetical protein
MVIAASQSPVIIDRTEYFISAPSADTIRHDERQSCTVFTVRPGDQAPYDRQRGRPYERAELISRAPFPFGKSATISFFQYIAPGSAATRPAIIGQIHNTGGQSERPQPFVAMRVNGGVQYIITHSGGERHAARKTAVRWSAPVVVGRWVHWVWEFTPDRVMTTLRIWRDGTAIFDAPLRLGSYDGPRGPYWQFGIYRSKDVKTMRVAYASVTMRPGPFAGFARAMAPAPPTCPVEPVG